VRTSVPTAAMSAADAVRSYKALARVERAFRTLKGVDLQIRPVYHWLEPRVRAHVFLCMLAYYVEWHLRRAWAPILFEDHDRAAAEGERASPVAAAELSPAAQRKRGRRRNDAGVPISGFRDLLDHLATLTLNTVALSDAPQATATVYARATPLQTTAFDLLGITMPRAQERVAPTTGKPSRIRALLSSQNENFGLWE
jgi:hypothetical protein